MTASRGSGILAQFAGLFSSLLRDRAGNTMAMIAAALIPLLALVGGGVDMGRSYLSQSRLQQACDAGVLAARKKIGSAAITDGVIPAAAQQAGERFFNLNFADKAYGTTGRDFDMQLETDLSISGEADVVVPTTVMAIFGYTKIPVHVECQAKLNFNNTDIMMVLDTTGSMAETNAGDTEPKIDILRKVVQSFYNQIETAKAPGTRIRYGFVPYSTNVNVGYLLKPNWMVDNWAYHAREQFDTGTKASVPQYSTEYKYISGTVTADNTYVTTSCPSDTRTWVVLAYGGNPATTETWKYDENGIAYSCKYLDSGDVEVTPTVYNHHIYTWKQTYTGTKFEQVYKWKYDRLPFDVSGIKDLGKNQVKAGTIKGKMAGTPKNPSNSTANFRGCIEERDTYEITDYDNVDFSKALDLDIDRVPNSGSPATQWRPMFHEISWMPKLTIWNTKNFVPGTVYDTADFLVGNDYGLSACPAPSRKLATMTSAQMSTYVKSLNPAGSTYHDIGMIWGGRLISPTGLFASENADLPGAPSSRHMIFLTDGITAPLDLSYGTYGIEPLDKRRWSPSSSLTLTQTVEKRFAVACNEVKKRNVTVWVIGFGTTLNPVMTECAGPGRFFTAKNATELNTVFAKIAATMGDLRVSR